MITDILYYSAHDFTIRDDNNESYFLHEAVNEPAAFARLTDSVLDAIWMHPSLEEAPEGAAEVRNRPPRAVTHRDRHTPLRSTSRNNMYRDVCRSLPFCFIPLQAERLLRRLKSRRFYRPVGKALTISTLPACAHCGCDTALKDRFCASCGSSTEDRHRGAL